MPPETSLLARAHTRARKVLLVLAVATAIACVQAPQAQAATRPGAASPFTCGQIWFARTYPGHPQFAVDWNLPGAGEADFGQPVLAGTDGVANVATNAGYGQMVTIDHGDGWTTLYAHLSAVAVTTGQRVSSGTVIGQVGRTGRADGSHLHQEQQLDGVRQPIEVDGHPVVASYSSRATSYQSANCAPPAEAKPVRRSTWGRCRSVAAIVRTMWCGSVV